MVREVGKGPPVPEDPQAGRAGGAGKNMGNHRVCQAKDGAGAGEIAMQKAAQLGLRAMQMQGGGSASFEIVSGAAEEKAGTEDLEQMLDEAVDFVGTIPAKENPTGEDIAKANKTRELISRGMDTYEPAQKAKAEYVMNQIDVYFPDQMLDEAVDFVATLPAMEGFTEEVTAKVNKLKASLTRAMDAYDLYQKAKAEYVISQINVYF
ncbi:hypothetical protein K0U07_03480 [bacterium]|nr:hypothetical protein [bacterium]